MKEEILNAMRKELIEVKANQGIINESEENLINVIYYKYEPKIKDTNNIYYCFGTYKYNEETDLEHRSKDVLVDRNDPNAIYRLYVNIENEMDIKKIPILDCKEFERNNHILNINNHYNGYEKYYELKDEFIKTSINESQEKAVIKILSR